MEKNKNEEKKLTKGQTGSVSKTYVLILLIIMWIGVAMCALSWTSFFVSSLDNFGIGILGIPGGILALAPVFILNFTLKCPYCGEKKIGRMIGVTLKKDVVCPDCHKKVLIK